MRGWYFNSHSGEWPTGIASQEETPKLMHLQSANAVPSFTPPDLAPIHVKCDQGLWSFGNDNDRLRDVLVIKN